MRRQHKKQQYTKTSAFIIQRVKGAFRDVFDNPVGRPAKKVLVAVAGVLITLLGILLIILPGPAFLLIPVGLAILATEYTFARKWLRKFQHWMTIYAKKADAFIERRRAKP
ncbi:PGPGW domain-containing protein [Aliikangiella sp. IMCC44359]|uniref:PGPGW domain-containing protein n=1 Tax=Aliikangiella sp. IMCC44359 TaxID=3459125 RepID=UPI00403AD2D0